MKERSFDPFRVLISMKRSVSKRNGGKEGIRRVLKRWRRNASLNIRQLDMQLEEEIDKSKEQRIREQLRNRIKKYKEIVELKSHFFRNI
jgi:hypothetical protein